MYASLKEIDAKLRDKLLVAMDIIPHTKKMIQLYDVPGLNTSMDDYRYTLDYTSIKQILRDDVGFPSMTKLVDDLQASLVRGTQQGLF